MSVVNMASSVAEACAVVGEMLLRQYIVSELINCSEVIKKKRRQRRWWVREWIKNRHRSGAIYLIEQELQFKYSEDFKNLLRMSENDFAFLLERVSLSIQKADTNMREAIPSKTKLMITLRYLATGDSFKSLEFFFKIPKSTISKFLVEVLDAIIISLKEFIKVSINKYKEIEFR